MFLSCNSCHSCLFPFSLYHFHLCFFLSEQYLMKAKRLTILSALGSALVTRVPIDRCRSPSSHFRTPLHLLATAILMRRSPSRLASIRSLKSFLQSGASHMVFTYLSCKVKNVILDLFPSDVSRHVFVHMVLRHMCKCMCSRVRFAITTYTSARDVFIR